MTLDGEKFRVVSGDKVSIKNAVSGSANPRPFFDGPVLIGDRPVYDGGMTENNFGAVPAVALALADGVPADRIKVFGLAIGNLKKDYVSSRALKNPMLYGSLPFDAFLGNALDKKTARLAEMLPNPKDQIALILPSCSDTTKPMNYTTSLIRGGKDLDVLDAFIDGCRADQFPNAPIPRMKGAATSYSASLAAAQSLFGLKPLAGAGQRLAQGHKKPAQTPLSVGKFRPGRAF